MVKRNAIFAIQSVLFWFKTSFGCQSIRILFIPLEMYNLDSEQKIFGLAIFINQKN